MPGKQTVIVTGASQGIGAAVVQAFLDRGYNVVATSRSFSNRPASRRHRTSRSSTETSVRQRRLRRSRQTAIGQIRLDRPCCQQCGHLLSQAFHGLHRR